MRILLTIFLLFVLSPILDAKDRTSPKVKITKVDQGKRNGLSTFDFFVKASDNEQVKRIEYFVAVDGKQSGWKKYPYYDLPGYTNHLPFTVDCDIFTFEVRSLDKAGNKSKSVKKSYSNLRG